MFKFQQPDSVAESASARCSYRQIREHRTPVCSASQKMFEPVH
ncbi:hypothetical protein ALP63_102499 [Pseudomonas syringae pv. aceris]|nr:hypothetical protein ALP69_102048 [Pseudomonas syringae pv. aceris]RMS62068.1 hypothetical protein ALP63_102499 [Pseudomonas syringae pv. aceris]